MPNLGLQPVPLYQPLDPINHVVENVVINAIVEQIGTVNAAVDSNTAVLVQAVGTQGTLANRLAQSLNPDGSLKTAAVDAALHSVEEHLDTASYVRMAVAERAKLSLVAAGATALALRVGTISGDLTFDTTLSLAGSDSVVWNYAGGKLTANTSFPAAVRHVHFYGVTPVPLDPVTPDYRNYFTTSTSTAYKQDSLRVYVNGVRLSPFYTTYVPVGLPSSVTYVLLSYTEGTAASGTVTGGDFRMSAAVPAAARLLVDFDQIY